MLSCVLILFLFLDLARLVREATSSGEEVHVQGSWPMTAMIWTASNLEARGRLFDVPLPVVVQLQRIQSVPVSPRHLLPQVATHPPTPRPGGVYRQDVGSFGEFVLLSLLPWVLGSLWGSVFGCLCVHVLMFLTS